MTMNQRVNKNVTFEMAVLFTIFLVARFVLQGGSKKLFGSQPLTRRARKVVLLQEMEKACICLLLLITILPACTSSDNLGVTPPTVTEPKLSSIQRNIFNVSCTTSSCHGNGGNAGELQLTSGNSYTQLVGIAGIADGDHSPKFLRVKPGNPDSSFLMIKLTGPSANQGNRMPRNNQSLPQAEIDAIRTWIQNGAQND